MGLNSLRCLERVLLIRSVSRIDHLNPPCPDTSELYGTPYLQFVQIYTSKKFKSPLCLKDSLYHIRTT